MAYFKRIFNNYYSGDEIVKYFYYDGRTFEYNEASSIAPFTFEIGRFNNAYKVHKYFQDHGEAIAYYESYQVSNGYKKRLRLDTQVIAKCLSARVK